MLIWKKFKYAIFDVDGTIFDNMPLCADAFIETVKSFQLPHEETRKIYMETNGMNLNDQFKLIFDKYGVKYTETLIEKLNKNFFDLRDDSKDWQNAPLFDGVKPFIDKLRENSVKNFVSSGSNTDEVIFRLKKAEIYEYFELAMGAEKIPKGLKHFEEFAKHCDILPSEFSKNSFLLSDGPNDMALAKKSGIFAIGIANTVSAAKLKSAGADLVVSNINTLLGRSTSK